MEKAGLRCLFLQVESWKICSQEKKKWDHVHNSFLTVFASFSCCIFGVGLCQRALAWSTAYMTFLPYALERRVSWEAWLWTQGTHCCSASATVKKLILLHMQKKKKKAIPISFFLAHGGTTSKAPVAKGQFLWVEGNWLTYCSWHKDRGTLWDKGDRTKWKVHKTYLVF